MQLDSYTIDVVSDGQYKLDGGAMFGVVPKVLWQREHPADEFNRIDLALNCLLVRSNDRVILVDTGMGDDWTDREREQYGLVRPNGGLLEDLARKGVQPSDVTDVVLTHLHFDHAGGCSRIVDGEPELIFKNATHWVQTQHLRWGQKPTQRDQRSFRPDVLTALLGDESKLEQVDGMQEILPGIRVMPVHGHTPGQQVVLVGPLDGPAVLFAADLVPFASQLHLPWVMAFDLNPLLTLQEKRDVLSRAVVGEWTVVYEHDPKRVATTVSYVNDRYVIGEEVTL